MLNLLIAFHFYLKSYFSAFLINIYFCFKIPFFPIFTFVNNFFKYPFVVKTGITNFLIDFFAPKVLDFGFRDLKEIREFTSTTKPIFDRTKYKKNENGKYCSNSIRFRSNELISIDGLKDIFESLIEMETIFIKTIMKIFQKNVIFKKYCYSIHNCNF